MTPTPRPRVPRRPWPFRRLAVVLSGGGALGAYEVGVLRSLDAAGLAPEIVIELSVGVINAVVWTAHGFRSNALERAWSRIGPASIGMRWTSLGVRMAGLALALVMAIEIVLSVMGLPALSVAQRFGRRVGSGVAASALFDVLAWTLVGVAGYVLARAAREVENRLARWSAPVEPLRWHRWIGRALLAGAGLNLIAWAFDLPWPHRFGATVLVVGGLLWLLTRRGRMGEWMRRAPVRALPESGGARPVGWPRAPAADREPGRQRRPGAPRGRRRPPHGERARARERPHVLLRELARSVGRVSRRHGTRAGRRPGRHDTARGREGRHRLVGDAHPVPSGAHRRA